MVIKRSNMSSSTSTKFPNLNEGVTKLVRVTRFFLGDMNEMEGIIGASS
jgi:hypothetical protein